MLLTPNFSHPFLGRCTLATLSSFYTFHSSVFCLLSSVFCLLSFFFFFFFSFVLKNEDHQLSFQP